MNIVRAVAIAALLLAIAGCAAGAWLASRPPLAPFLVPGATDVEVTELGFGRRVISYNAPGSHYEWYFTVTRNLETSRWLPPDRWGLARQLNTYTRVSPLWFGYLWEQADLHGEPSRARIIVGRWLDIPWRRYLNR